MNLIMARRPRTPAATRRGLELVHRHCASLDLDTPRARERLERKLGAAHAQFLVEALCARPAMRHDPSFGFAA